MNTVGLYIHIPFCKNKCFYCDFPSFSGKESLMVDYAKALSKEIDNSCQDKLISTIFIGGGTPTYLCIEGWKIIAESIKKLNFVSKDFEFTVEGNPNSFNEEQLEIFKTMGVNRISMGLQAVQEHHLKSIGRIHTIEDFKKSYIMLRENGFNNINVDLMFGLPNQTLAEWIESLEQVIELKPEHLSCYSLIIEEGTKFYNLYENESLILPNEDVERDMYAVTKDILKKNGYEQYEISNYAKKGFECKHNKIYWQLNNYVGCGSSSHSYINGIRYRNESNIEKYIGRMNESNTVVVEEFKNSEKDDIEEFMFLGLRLNDGIDIREFQHRFGVSIFDKYKDIIEKYVHMELLNLEENRLFLTSKGMEFSNQVMADFIL
ncbi:radical SAM family heme chaperone HemW [Clostridium culturomicium]|uniref:radical SAM family heme chaperone HemW n=1 Tax=Clostridium culturomicium TaxID=1499683 RepID=UPI00058E20A6|nr:radical SAM family heme chaperone HemW [Clostridium culturomicium]